MTPDDRTTSITKTYKTTAYLDRALHFDTREKAEGACRWLRNFVAIGVCDYVPVAVDTLDPSHDGLAWVIAEERPGSRAYIASYR